MGRKVESCSKPSAVQKTSCLKLTMEKLFEKRSRTGDIKFIVDDEEIRAHRCVLAALSPKYEAQFYGAMAEKDTINVRDVSPAAFKEFLQFFYTEDVTLTLDNIEDVLNLAKQSLVDELVAECTNFLMTVIGVDKLLWCYQLALAYDVKPLEEFCVKHIDTDIKSVFKTTDFLSCERDMLGHILELDSLNCKETEVFDACISWARAKCEQQGIAATDTSILRVALGEAFFKIRFCSMTFEDFAALSRMHTGLFSVQQSTEVIRAIALNGKKPEMFDENNNKPRRPMEWCLECSIGKGSPIRFQSALRSDSIDFYCNQPINLNGFVICNRIVGDIEFSILLSGKPYRPDTTITLLKNETKITFREPVQIPSREWCYIFIESEKFNSKSGKRLLGYKLKRKISQGGVKFKIAEPACNNAHLITRLLFDNKVFC